MVTSEMNFAGLLMVLVVTYNEPAVFCAMHIYFDVGS